MLLLEPTPELEEVDDGVVEPEQPEVAPATRNVLDTRNEWQAAKRIQKEFMISV